MSGQQAVTDEPVGRNPNLGAILPRLRKEFEHFYGDRLAQVILYGSQARGDARRWSDIDILVILKGPVRPGEEIERTGEIVAGLSLEFDTVIECLFVDEARFASLGSAVIENAAREGVLI